MLDPVSPDELALALGQLRQSPSDEGAWRSIYSRLYPYVVAVAYRRVRDKTIAEDIAQEVFVRIARLRPFDRIDDPEHFRAYVWRMAINVAHSFARSVRRERDQQALWDQSGSSASVEPAVSDDHLAFKELVQLASDSLEPEDRIMLQLLLEDRTLSDVATELGISYSAAGVRLHRFRRKLRKFLASEERNDNPV
jgi:RNA polymerase sigma-70 factor (ECF subfamily)